MTTSEKRLARRTLLLGFVLTLLVFALDVVGTFSPLEHYLYDLRARTCQFFSPKPSDDLVYIDIDDQSLLEADAFPWPRNTFPAIVDEIRRAGATTLAFDVLFTERQSESDISTNAKLAQSFRSFGKVLVPASFGLNTQEHSPAFAPVRDALVSNLELTPEQIARQTNLPVAAVNREYSEAIRDAMSQRIALEYATAATQPTLASLRALLLPGTDPSITDSMLLRLLSNELEREQSRLQFRQFARTRTAGVNLLAAQSALTPISALSDAASATGFVDYLPTSDGVVRSMPLLIQWNGGVYPQEGLALACAVLGINPADPRQLVVSKSEITLNPRGRATIHIPVHSVYSRRFGRTGDCFIDIPWYGSTDWADPFARFGKNPHVLISDIWQLAQSRKALLNNNAAADDAIKRLLSNLSPDRLKAFNDHPPAAEDFSARATIIVSIFKELKDAGWLDAYANKKPSDFQDEDNRLTLGAILALEQIQATAPKLTEMIQKQSEFLHKRLAGKAALLGYVATAAAASDFVPTPLHPRCPGVIIHGTIFNGIMTGELWRPIPRWLDALITLVIGFLASCAVAFLSPWKALAATAALLAGYLAFNGIVLFDYFNLATNSAGGTVIAASLVIFTGCILARLLIEGIERARITRRFRAYNDPALVDEIIEHPELERQLTAGQSRTLTVVFTDIAGFTSITEKLGPDSVRIINDYLEVMVPIVRRHNGYVNKFMGDGMMFFFNAPRANPEHAPDAVACVLDMQKALPAFNERLVNQNLPTIGMRAGIATGELIVGDAGTSDRSDYTAMGDSANLASRLEGANKTTGTHNLLTQSTADLLKDRFLLRPVGKLQVVGKAIAIDVYEAICALADAIDAQRLSVSLTKQMIESFQSCRFSECIELAIQLEAHEGASKLAALYLTLARLHQAQPPAAPFAGQITLAEK